MTAKTLTVREHRTAANLTRQALATRAGLSRSTVERVEAGHLGRISTYHKLAGALGVNVLDITEFRVPFDAAGAAYGRAAVARAVLGIPLTVNEGAHGDTVLLIELSATEEELAGYEVIEDTPRSFREFLIPADVLNSHATMSVIEPPDEWIN